MPKFLDDIKFIDSQGDEHNVSEYNNQIRVQGWYYTGDSHFNEFDREMPVSNIPDGKISKQGSFYTGLNADGKGNVQNGIISDQGKILTGLELNEENNTENSAKISNGKISIQGSFYTGLNAVGQGNVQDGLISDQGKILTGLELNEENNTENSAKISEGKISIQGSFYTGLNAVGGDLSGVSKGEISEQGRYFTGLNAGDESVITKKNKEITEFDSSFKYKYGDIVSVTSDETTNYYKCIKGIPGDESIEISNTEYWKKIDKDDAFYYDWNYNIKEAEEGEIYKQGRYWVDRVEEVAQTGSIWGAIDELQQKDTVHDSEITALQQKDVEHDSEINALQQYNNEFNLENGTGDVLIQTKDSNHSFKVITDGRVKVYGEPIESDDVLRLNEFSVLTQEQADSLF